MEPTRTDLSSAPHDRLTKEHRVLDADELVNHLHTAIAAQPKNGRGPSASLLRELHEHHADLELQNEHLRESRLDLERQRDQLALLYDEAPIGYITIDRQGYIQAANQCGLELLGRKIGRVLYQPVALFVRPESRPRLRQHLQELFRQERYTDKPSCVEIGLFDRTRQRLAVRLQSRPHFDRNGRVDRVDIAIIDLSETRAAQEQLRSEQELADSLLDNARLIIVLIDEHGRIRRCNHYFECLLDTPLDSILQQNLVDLCIDPSEHERARRGFSAHAHQKQAWTMNMNLRLNDGSTRAIEWSNTRVSVDNDPSQNGVLCIGNDVTVMQNLKKKEQRHIRQLAHIDRLALVHQLTGQLAHELNQPLTAVLSYGHVIQSRLAEEVIDREFVIETLGKLRLQSRRAGQIIHHLRRYAARRTPELESISLNDCITEALSLIEIDLREHSLRVDVDLDLHLSTVLADKLMIEQVIVNLLRNALEATVGQDSGRRWLRVRTQQMEDTVVLSIEDSGPGIPPKTLEKVLNGFFTTKQNGVGLGLAICRSIVEIHNGRLSAAPITDGGQSLCVRLPSQEKPSQESIEQPSVGTQTSV